MSRCIKGISILKDKFININEDKMLENGILLMLVSIMIYNINYVIGTRIWLVGLICAAISMAKHYYDTRNIPSRDNSDDIWE